MSKLAAVLFLLLAGGREAVALEVAGLQVPERAVVGGEELVLNGAGVRSKFFIKVYVGALYLAERRNTAKDAVGTRGPKRMTMRFLHNEVGVDSIVEAWKKGFEANLTAGESDVLEGEMKLFSSFFKTVRAGEYYDLDYVPGEGTIVSLNGAPVGRVPGDRFYRALLMVWLGPQPADGNLKRNLLGGN